MNNRDRQVNELTALASIYNEEELSTFDLSRLPEINDELGGTFVAEIECAKDLVITTRVEGKCQTVRHLAPIFLSFSLPKFYPSNCAPEFSIVNSWMNESQISRLSTRLIELWDLNKGSEVLFLWTDFLRHESVEFLNLTSPLVLQPNEFKSSVEYDAARRLMIFEKSTFTCDVCFESKPGFHCVAFTPCGHVFCRACVKADFELKIQEGSLGLLACLSHPCESTVDHDLVKSLVSSEMFERYDRLLLQGSLNKMSDIQYCPGRNCSYPVTIDRDAGLGICPNCKYVFCVYCKKASHGINACEDKMEALKELFDEYQNSDSAGKKILIKRHGKKVIQSMLEQMSEKWLTENSKRCPECKCKIEKTGGCHNMYCTKCNTYFCWLCLEVLQKDSSYAHFSNRASDCYNKLFFGVENEDPVFEEENFAEEWNEEEDAWNDGGDGNWNDETEDSLLDNPGILDALNLGEEHFPENDDDNPREIRKGLLADLLKDFVEGNGGRIDPLNKDPRVDAEMVNDAVLW